MTSVGAGAAEGGRADAEEETVLLVDFDLSLRVVLDALADADEVEAVAALAEETFEEARAFEDSGRRSSNPKQATLG